MIGGSISGLGHLDAILQRLRQVQDLDLAPLARTIGQIIAEDNEAGLMAGLDADGVPFTPLAASTREHRDGDGPPGVPDFGASSLIAGFRVEVNVTSTGIEIRAGWPNSPKIRYFSEGTRHQSRRNLVGLRPETKAKIVQAVNDFARAVIRSN